MSSPASGARLTWREKVGLAEMLKGGVIMDVVNPEQARIAEDAGAVAVMALERVPADIRRDGGVARMSDPEMILGIKAAVSIPVMAKCRIGHFVEAEILEALEIDFVDESEVLTPADEENHVDKHAFRVPFVCGARNLGEALRRCGEGAAMIRTKGEAGTGDVVEAVRHMRQMVSEIRSLRGLRDEELVQAAKKLGERDRDLKQIESEAYKKIQEIEGAADAKATEIYAKAYNQTPEAIQLFEFTKAMDTLKKTITPDTTLVLTTDGELLHYLKSSEPVSKNGGKPGDLLKGINGLPSLLDLPVK